MLPPAESRRRDFCRRLGITGLTAAGLGSTTALAGCLGGRESIHLGVGPPGSRTQQAGQALSATVSRHSQEISLVIHESGGPRDRLLAADNGELSAVALDNTALYRASRGDAPFDDSTIESLPQQGLCFGRTEQFWLTATDDLDSTADLESGGWRLYPVQPGFRSRLATEQLLRAADLWESNEIDNRPVDRVATAIEAGEIDVLAVVTTNGRRLADWCRDVDEQVGETLRPLAADGAFGSAIESTPNTVAIDADTAGFQRMSLPPTVAGWAVPHQWLFSSSVSPTVSHELARVIAEQGETLVQFDSLAEEWTEPASMAAGLVSEYPVHPGVADFFDAAGVWDTQWNRGERESTT